MEGIVFAPAAGPTTWAVAAAAVSASPPVAAGGGSPTATATAANLQSYIGYCSNGRALMSRDTSMVLDNIQIPCPGAPSGTYDGMTASWNPTGCDFGDLLGWGDAAVEAAKQQLLGEDGLKRFRHVVLVLPRDWKNGTDPGAGCRGFVATAEAGIPRINPDGTPAYGMVWVSGDRYDSPNAYLHELSHNLGLYHAGTPNGCQYCDRSCAVSYCCVMRCHNAAHLWALGWADPLPASTPAVAAAAGGVEPAAAAAADGGSAEAAMGGSLVLEGLTEGLTLPYRLPAQHSSDATYVMIDASPGGSGDGIRYFLSYRRPDPLYDALYPADTNMVHVHAHLPPALRMGTSDTLQLARLGPGTPGGGAGASSGAATASSPSLSSWSDIATRLVVTALAWERSYAVVALCRAPLRAANGGAAAAAGSTLVAVGALGSAAGGAGGSSAAVAVDWAACAMNVAAVLRAMSPPSPTPAPPTPSMPTPPSPVVGPLAASVATGTGMGSGASTSKGTSTGVSPGGRTDKAGRAAGAAPRPPSPAPFTPPPVPAPTAAGTSPGGGKARGGGRERSSNGLSSVPQPPLPPPSPAPSPPSAGGGSNKRGLAGAWRDAVMVASRRSKEARVSEAGDVGVRRRRQMLEHRRART